MSWNHFHFAILENRNLIKTKNPAHPIFKNTCNTVMPSRESITDDQAYDYEDRIANIVGLSSRRLYDFPSMKRKTTYTYSGTNTISTTRSLAMWAKKNQLDPNNKEYQKIIQEWLDEFGKDYKYKFSFEPEDFDRLGNSPVDSLACFRQGDCYQYAPMLLYMTKDSFVLWIYNKDDKIVGRAWGLVVNDYHIYITNYYLGNSNHSAYSNFDVIKSIVDDATGRNNSYDKWDPTVEFIYYNHDGRILTDKAVPNNQLDYLKFCPICKNQNYGDDAISTCQCVRYCFCPDCGCEKYGIGFKLVTRKVLREKYVLKEKYEYTWRSYKVETEEQQWICHECHYEKYEKPFLKVQEKNEIALNHQEASADDAFYNVRTRY